MRKFIILLHTHIIIVLIERTLLHVHIHTKRAITHLLSSSVVDHRTIIVTVNERKKNSTPG